MDKFSQQLVDTTLNGTFIGGEVAAFDLGQVPPIPLSLGPDAGWLVSWSRGINIMPDASGRQQLQIQSIPSPDQCFVDFSQSLAWNGQWFDLAEVKVDFDPSQFECIYLLEAYNHLPRIVRRALLERYNEPPGEIFPTGINGRTGEPYALNASDEWRYRLALHHGLLGNKSEAEAYLNQIIAHPASPDSSWISPAQAFLAAYQTPAHIYAVCAQAPVECSLQMPWSKPSPACRLTPLTRSSN